MARLRRSVDGFEEWLVGHPGVERGVMRVAEELRDEVEHEIVRQAYDTGRLSRAVTIERGRSRMFGRTKVVVRSNAGQGEPAMLPQWINKGTGIYGPRRRPITPKKAKVLRFTPKGSSTVVFARSVRGMRPRTYMADAARTVGARRGLRFKPLR